MNHSNVEAKISRADLTDVSLLEHARLGDGAAFELIVRRHNSSLFRAARGVLNNEHLAQEAVQDAYLSAFIHLDSYQSRASLKTWLTRIVINQAISSKRRQRPDVSLDEKVIFLHGLQPEEKQAVSSAVDHITPEIAASQQEIKSLLDAAIERLPDMYRSVFMLRAVEGMSVIESAFCLQVTESAVKKRLSRAREMLRNDLLQQFDKHTFTAFEFAGKRCDAVTLHVMTELHCRGMIKAG